MDLVDLTRRPGAPTLFSRLPRAQLLALLTQSPRRQVAGGSWLSDTVQGLKNHLVLLSGELEAQRTWTEADGSQNTFPGVLALVPVSRATAISSFCQVKPRSGPPTRSVTRPPWSPF